MLIEFIRLWQRLDERTHRRYSRQLVRVLREVANDDGRNRQASGSGFWYLLCYPDHTRRCGSAGRKTGQAIPASHLLNASGKAMDSAMFDAVFPGGATSKSLQRSNNEGPKAFSIWTRSTRRDN
jgi:hypothetical protein